MKITLSYNENGKEIILKGESDLISNSEENKGCRLYCGKVKDVESGKDYFIKYKHKDFDPNSYVECVREEKERLNRISSRRLVKEGEMKFRSPFICYIDKCIEVKLTEEDNGSKSYFIQCLFEEYIENKRLDNFYAENTVDEKTKLRHMYQLLLGAQAYMSVKNDSTILHRDIKPGNILIDNNGKIVFIDFEWGYLYDTLTRVNEVAINGTPLYMHPKQHYKGTSNFAGLDFYSLAMVFIYILKGEVLFEFKPEYYKNTERVYFMYKEDFSFTVDEFNRYQTLLSIIAKMMAGEGQQYTSIEDIIADFRGFLYNLDESIYKELVYDDRKKVGFLPEKNTVDGGYIYVSVTILGENKGFSQEIMPLPNIKSIRKEIGLINVSIYRVKDRIFGLVGNKKEVAPFIVDKDNEKASVKIDNTEVHINIFRREE